MKKSLFLAIALVVSASVAFVACGTNGGSQNSTDVIKGTGTVEFIELEGGFYGIVADDSQKYDPINLAKEFQTDGLRVRFEAKLRTDVATIRQWGKTIEITKIEKVSGG